MRREITLSILALTPLCAWTQQDDKTVVLGEVVVKAAKVVSKIDGLTIYPTEAQKESSADGYGILQKLSLPNIRVDKALHALSAIDNRGDVQVRINGIVAGKQEMLSLPPKSILRVNFINNPGVRYGEGVAYVIDIITRRADNGHTVGVDLSPTLTSLQGDGTVYGKWNSGKSELSLSYGASGYKLRGNRSTEVADYTLTDGSVLTMERADVATQRRRLSHEAKLTYNWADSTACVFQTSLSCSLYDAPGNYSVKAVTDGDRHYTATIGDSGRGGSPVADLYFFRQLTPRQSITANAVGTYMFTKASHHSDEGTPYAYHVDGRSASVLSEVIYENRLRPFTLSAGLNCRLKHTKNDYTGDASALTEMSNGTAYAFAEISGRLSLLQYSLGTGVSYIHYRQDAYGYDYWTLRPKASLACDIAPHLQLSYSFTLRDKVSRMAMVSDATLRSNRMEWTVGNPNLKPNREREHTLRLAYNASRWQVYADGYLKRCIKPNMALYERTADDRFVYTQVNQKEIDVLQATLYACYWAIPEKLRIVAYGGLNRCFNFGTDYTHCYTSFFYVAYVTAYLGKLTLEAQADNGYRFLEGENKGYNGGCPALQAAYKWGDCQLSLTWTSPFFARYKTYESEILNRNLHKWAVGFDRDGGNRIMLNIAWRISRGKKHRSAEKAIQLNDTDNGIMK